MPNGSSAARALRDEIDKSAREHGLGRVLKKLRRIDGIGKETSRATATPHGSIVLAK